MIRESAVVEIEVLDALEGIVMAGVAMTTRVLAEAPAAYDMTLPMWRVMVILGTRPDGATVSEVARLIEVTVPATSRQLRRLAGRGLVSLGPDERDHRAVRARLTEAGVRFRADIMGARRQALAQALRPLELSEITVRELGAIAALIRPRP
jgi:DNA-binding MarR family transcriptional regulator